MHNLNVIVGTAGHVDHGKTCLIKALTGTDTDRLEEEKKRGITIELGFTDMPNDRGIHVGIIDVPGHERFVKNMLAGIGGIDMVLLVIGADEGVMPQTVEHFEILKMLQIKKGIVVLTKSDLVDEEWMEIVREDAKELVSGTFLEGMPVMEVSSYTGHNIEELKNMICDMVETCDERNNDPDLLRIPVDRVFTIDGFGTVITGTLIEGSCRVGSEVEIYPEGKTAKVRSVQVHGNSVDQAMAGQRTAINLTGIKKEEVQRGNVVAAARSLQQTMMLDVKISMFNDTKRSLINGSRLHLYYGSDEVLCKAILLEEEALESGREGYAQLRLEAEIAVKKGDRFIVRFYSPVETIGGGIVLDANPQKHKRFHQEVIHALKIKENGTPKDLLEQTAAEQSRNLVVMKEIVRKLGFNKEEAQEYIDQLLQEERLIQLTEEWLVHKNYLSLIKTKSEEILTKYHQANPISPGLQKEEYRKKLGDKLHCADNKAIEAMIKRLLSDEEIRDSGNLISDFHFQIQYTEEQSLLRDSLLAQYKKAGMEIPELSDVLAGCKDKNLARTILEDLAQRGMLEKLNHPYYMDGDCYRKALQQLRQRVEENGSITLAEFRDMLGTSRKYAVMILESLDERKITRKVDDARVLN